MTQPSEGLRMTPLPRPPIEVPRIVTLNVCAPLFREAVAMVLADVRAAGHHVMVWETLRTVERQEWLYGFGRYYTDGRANGGTVTNAQGLDGWHPYGLAADLVEEDGTPWKAPTALWRAIGESAERRGLTWGGRWKNLDLPHVQWGKCRKSPSALAKQILARDGLPAVWRAVGAL